MRSRVIEIQYGVLSRPRIRVASVGLAIYSGDGSLHDAVDDHGGFYGYNGANPYGQVSP